MDLHWRQGSEAFEKHLVVRWPPTGFAAFPRHAYGMGRQFRLLKGLATTAVPVPPVLWMEEDASVIGLPFYIMEKVDGWVPGDFPPYHVAGPLFDATEADRARIWWNAIDTMARVHSVDCE